MAQDTDDVEHDAAYTVIGWLALLLHHPISGLLNAAQQLAYKVFDASLRAQNRHTIGDWAGPVVIGADVEVVVFVGPGGR
jgi:hypothetical protein